jgi:hypothetical protein
VLVSDGGRHTLVCEPIPSAAERTKKGYLLPFCSFSASHVGKSLWRSTRLVGALLWNISRGALSCPILNRSVGADLNHISFDNTPRAMFVDAGRGSHMWFIKWRGSRTWLAGRRNARNLASASAVNYTTGRPAQLGSDRTRFVTYFRTYTMTFPRLPNWGVSPNFQSTESKLE